MFSSVNSIFQYSAQHRKLLLRAKEGQDPAAISEFFEVYSEIFRSALQQIVQRENVSMVVLPRLSLRRVVSLNWHSVDFFRRELEELSLSTRPSNEFSIYMRSPFPSRKRAQMSSGERIKSVENGARNYQSLSEANSSEEKMSSDDEISAAVERISVLFVDDVLTSGGTLLREFDGIRNQAHQFFAGQRLLVDAQGRRLRLNLNAHILTLFRTPVADSKRGESE